jgi:hypothetical protein
MEQFLSKHEDAVVGTVSGFDRLVFRGTLRLLAHCAGMMRYLWAAGVLLKDFAAHSEGLTRRLKEASEGQARQAGRPIRYLSSSTSSKEQVARKIATADGIGEGLVCILTVVEPCFSYEIRRDHDTRNLRLQPQQRKCLFLYHYQIHPTFGFMHARIQTWFPFSIQVCINGREWLARMMEVAGLRYVRRENCFTWLEDPDHAQRLMDQQVKAAWPDLLNGIARSLNPLHETIFQAFPVEYYWSTFQSEWATDILFRNAAALARLYPKLVQHGMLTFSSSDVMRFLGRNIPPTGILLPQFQAEVVSDLKKRPEGVRIKHRLGDNTIKMYDKQGSVLRVETTINDAMGFKTFRAPEGKPNAAPRWQRMRKGIADLHRRAEVSQAANNRYLRAIASVESTSSLGELTAHLCLPAIRNGHRVRPLNPYAPGDAKLLEAIGRGEFSIRGFRNRDLRPLLFPAAPTSTRDQRRQSAAVSRKLQLLRAHRLIRKVPHTHRYHLTAAGRLAITALVTARNANTEMLSTLAA